jgi:hypothetical protein
LTHSPRTKLWLAEDNLRPFFVSAQLMVIA